MSHCDAFPRPLSMKQSQTHPNKTVATIEVNRLSKVYAGGIEAVKSVDFEVQPGEVFGLLGPNGAGKSTIIGMLTTTIRPTSGRAKVAGFDVASSPIEARRRSATVFQEAVVDQALTGLRNLEIHARLWGASPREAKSRVSDTVEAFALNEIIDRAVGTYSGGQRRRLEIARGLLSRPQVLFLDEPTVGLDPRIRHELLDVISGIGANGDMTTMLTTHYLDEAEKLCDRVAIIDSGTIVALDTPEQLLSALGGEILELRVQGDGAAALAQLQYNRIADENAFSVGSTITVPLRGLSASDAMAATAELGLITTSVSTRQPSLDDVYLRLTGRELAA
jgi:ABC-2 type transport system ATP-binding protein